MDRQPLGGQALGPPLAARPDLTAQAISDLRPGPWRQRSTSHRQQVALPPRRTPAVTDFSSTEKRRSRRVISSWRSRSIFAMLRRLEFRRPCWWFLNCRFAQVRYRPDSSGFSMRLHCRACYLPAMRLCYLLLSLPCQLLKWLDLPRRNRRREKGVKTRCSSLCVLFNYIRHCMDIQVFFSKFHSGENRCTTRTIFLRSQSSSVGDQIEMAPGLPPGVEVLTYWFSGSQLLPKVGPPKCGHFFAKSMRSSPPKAVLGRFSGLVRRF